MVFAFDYRTAFSRNIGWVTEQEQQILKFKRVAIAGMGGVGGSHLLTLARLGIGAFNIADFDVFELGNFNRQAGATVNHLNRPKVDALAGMALDINPDLDLKRFPEGVTENNLSEFFTGVDVYVDGLDFFAFKARRAVFAACHELGIPAVTAAPLGMGAALLAFMPGKMSFEEYFGFEGCSEEEMALRFLLGLAPAGLHRGYLVEPGSINLKERRGPSTAIGCELCAGFAGGQVVKILLNRGKVLAAPHGLQFDAFENRLKRTWRPGGARNPIQRLGVYLGLRQLSKKPAALDVGRELEPRPNSTLEQILDVARWAPSGDNTQPWRFEIVSDSHLVVHGFDTRDHCVYDLDGHPSQIAVGALLENIRIAASHHGLAVTVSRRETMPETRPTFDIRFKREAGIVSDPLYPYIPVRMTQRRCLSPESLSPEQKRRMEEAAGPGYRILWLDGAKTKLKMAKLLFRNARIRLTIPEAYEVHKSIIQWNSRFSEDRIPDKAIGLDPLAIRLMKWALASWQRTHFLSTYLGGTLLPRIQLDWLPALYCAAHFIIVADRRPETIDDYVEAGRAMQRVWLTAARLGLHAQPEMTPLIFSRYVRTGRRFTTVEKAQATAQSLADDLMSLIGREESLHAVFAGRIGRGNRPDTRSLRLPLDKLMLQRTKVEAADESLALAKSA
jgi:molybdopterin/thiamine biosynthesis adenylyltransferase